MSVLADILVANTRYAETFDAGVVHRTPSRQVAIVTCMDARLDVFEMLGLRLGDAHVIRNAGGRVTDDVIRSLVVSQHLLGTREIVVIHHTDCGLLTYSNETMRAIVQESRGVDASSIDFLPIRDLEQSVADDVATIRRARYLTIESSVSGLIYDVATGLLRLVV